MTDTHSEKMRTLVTRLHQKTTEKAVEWSSNGNAANQRLSTELGSNKIQVEYYQYRVSGSMLTDVKVSITNKNGVVTDTITDSDLSAAFDSPDDYSSWYAFMKEIIEMGQRQILKADDVLDDVISSLE